MAQFAPARSTSRGAIAVWTVAGALGVAVLALLLGLVGAAIGIQLDSVAAAIVWRGLLAGAGLLLATRGVYTVGRRIGVANLAPGTFAVCVAGYLLDPLAWSGRALVSQLLVGPGVIATACDLALWVLVSGAGIHRAASAEASPSLGRGR